ncbi:MAG: hypothetical protein JWM68_1167 [Verrucomicrobiales bacterium]|nr:hypothetical protein [Verrucomicrobiales bacterium]
MKNLVLALILPTVARKAQAAALQVIRALVLCLLLIPLSDQIARGQSFLGNAVSLNGTNQYVTIPNFGNIIPTNEVTVEFWVYTTKAIGQSAFILNPDATTNRFNGHINYGTPPVDGSTYWDFGNINSSGRLSVAAPVNSLSNWVHYALVSSQSTIPPSLSVYTNGVLQTNKFGASTFVRGSYSLLIGGGSGFPFNGRIDEFRVWNVARSAAQIQASYTAPLVGNEANLVVYYKFDNASGTVATNSATATGATYDGTVTNNPAWVGSVPATSVPTVMTLAATGVSNTVAQLNGTVNPNFYATTAWLEWGLYAANNTNSTALVSVGNGSSSVSVTNVLSGLTPGVTYHVRIAASNIWGVARGKDVSFVSPAVALNGAASVTNECHAAFTDSGATVAVRPLALAGGGNHNVALKSDGTVVAWGNSADGRTNTAGLSNVVDVAAGFEHSLALKRDGTVVAWGKNAYLQTNVPAGLSNVVAIAAGNTHSLALKSNGTVTGWGDNDNSTTIIPPASVANAVAVAAGEWFSVALKSSGTVVAWGYNDSNNQTNVPTGLTNVVAISSGRTHSIALKSDGTVIGWGNTANGRTNTAGLSNVVAIAAGGSHNLVLKRDGTVIAWGDNSQGQTNVPTSLSNVVAIAAGDLHSLALKSDGTIVGWGLLSFGITNPPGNLPTFSSVVTVSGTFNTNNAPGTYALNYTATNVLGGSNTVSRTIVVQDTVKPVLTMLGNSPITNSLNVAFVDPGATALDACAGSVSVSTNSTVNVSVPGSYTVTYTATDSFSNTTNVVRTVVVAGSPIVTTLPATGVSNSVATLHGTVIPNGLTTAVWFEWGLSASSTTNITSTWYAGNVSFSVPINDTVSGFTAGLTYYYRTVATNSLGVVRGNAVAFGSPVIALNGGTLSSECHTAFTDPATAKGAPRAIAAGDSHSLAIKSDGTVIAWGAGKTDTGSPPEHGQSIIPANVSNVLALASGIYHNLALKSDMTVVAWGRNFDGETNIPVGLTNAVGVAAGYSHSLVLRSTGTVAVWGNNAYGQTNVPAG